MSKHSVSVCAALLASVVLTIAGAGAAEPPSEPSRVMVRFALGPGYGFASDEIRGPEADVSFAMGGYTASGLAVHLTGLGAFQFPSDTKVDVYFYGVGVGATYSPAPFFVSTSVVYGRRQSSLSSRGDDGPGVELLIGGAWGKRSSKAGVGLGIVGYTVEPEYAGRKFAVSPTVRLVVSVR